MPIDVQAICKEVSSLLERTLRRFLTLLRWSQDIRNDHILWEFDPSLYWRIREDGFYYAAPTPKSEPFTLEMRHGVHWVDSNISDFKTIWNKPNAQESLGHELLREAVSVCETSPRSALLILCSALETAVKQHISFVVPKSAWLVREAPTPPVFKILQKYFPDIIQEESIRSNWAGLSKVFNVCKDLIEKRNLVAHRGNFEGAEKLKEYIDCVRDVLYIIDVLEGNEWAKNWVSPSIGELFSWTQDERYKSRNTSIEIQMDF